MKNSLYTKCLNYDFEQLFKRKGYAYFTKGAYNLNIIGIRTNHNNEITNKFDDFLILIYNTPNGKNIRHIYDITTEPGTYYMQKGLLNPKGAAILVPGQYRGCWQIGLHRGKYKALCQKKAVKVYRDGNKDDKYDLKSETIEDGIFGINIHRASQTSTTNTVDKYSAGCQVFKINMQFQAFIRYCEKQRELYGNSFTYTLINEDDLI